MLQTIKMCKHLQANALTQMVHALDLAILFINIMQENALMETNTILKIIMKITTLLACLKNQNILLPKITISQKLNCSRIQFGMLPTKNHQPLRDGQNQLMEDTMPLSRMIINFLSLKKKWSGVTHTWNQDLTEFINEYFLLLELGMNGTEVNLLKTYDFLIL